MFSYLGLITFYISVLQAVDEFVFQLAAKETAAEKQNKISALNLHDKEWTQVRLFCNILQMRDSQCLWYRWLAEQYTTYWWQHVDNAQQAFSAAAIPTLQHALPALEKLYTSC